MSTSPIFRLMPPVSPAEKDLKQDLNSVRKALNAGDLEGAQHAFTQFIKDAKENRQGYAFQHPGLRRDMQSLEQALKTGNLSMAQQAFEKFQQALRGGANGGESSSEASRFDVMA